MNSNQPTTFLQTAETIILDNLANEKFGVSELAESTYMSRSNLLRKIKKQSGLSASQFIRNVRLEKSKEFLNNTELNVSEIAYEVGFANVSYYIKCYREHFGYPPGEERQNSIKVVEQENVKEQNHKEEVPILVAKQSNFELHKNKIIAASVLVTVLCIALFWLNENPKSNQQIITATKSIAVLPFKNMSADSTNLYFVNGLMEASLNNLQRIKDLRVISRTSTEKYRYKTKTVSEIAEELNVNYLVEGSGQKIGDKVLLNIQLIDVQNDTPIWVEQYQEQYEDIFALQNTVAKKIAIAIKANITPQEFKQIDKKPTENLLAYDLYLQGLELLKIKNSESYLAAIELFDKATKEDPEFAMAYAQMAISFYYLDEYKVDKKYRNELNINADKALLYDSKSELSLIAKALYYINNNEFKLAVPHLEKALEYNPNSSPVILFLSTLFAGVIPDTANYLKYSLKGIKLNIQANNPIGKSFVYLNLANSLAQTGFIDESITYINKSIEENPQNPYAPYLKIYINYAKYLNLKETTNDLLKEWQKDSTRLDILQEVGKMYYFQEDYNSAYTYYSKYVAMRKASEIDRYPQENLKIAVVFEKMGYKEEAQKFLELYKTYCKNDKSIYQPASLAIQYVYEGKYDEAITQYKLFATKDNFQYWVVLFMEKDPLIQNLKNHPDYKATIKKIKDKFWENHQEIKLMLQKNNLL